MVVTLRAKKKISDRKNITLQQDLESVRRWHFCVGVNMKFNTWISRVSRQRLSQCSANGTTDRSNCPWLLLLTHILASLCRRSVRAKILVPPSRGRPAAQKQVCPGRLCLTAVSLLAITYQQGMQGGMTEEWEWRRWRGQEGLTHHASWLFTQ